MRETKRAMMIGIVLLHTIAVPGWGDWLTAWGWDKDGQVSNTPSGGEFVAASAGHGRNVAIVTSANGVPGFGPDSADFGGLIVKA